MGIKSEPFQGVILSGKTDIEKFELQIESTAPTTEAITTVAAGVKLVAEFKQKGYATFTAKGAVKAR
jgi:hypothetical protein